MKKQKKPKSKTYKKPRKYNARKDKKYPGLDKTLNLKIRSSEIDYDYLDKLNDEEKEWLNSFSEEYIGANFDHRGKILHTSKRQKRKCYAKNNARNRCVYSKAKAQNEVVDGDPTEHSTDNIEDVLIEIVDKIKDSKKAK